MDANQDNLQALKFIVVSLVCDDRLGTSDKLTLLREWKQKVYALIKHPSIHSKEEVVLAAKVLSFISEKIDELSK